MVQSAAPTFAQRLIAWQRDHGRHDLPWQGRDAYGTWLSEIMLQQTQVASVIPYYHRFLASFPTVASLAAAPLDDVLAHWAGLGYYRRARQLHAAAQMVMAEFGGQFPQQQVDLLRLPGIGRSTAAAIAAFVHSERVAILDGNVKRVLTRWAGISGFPGERAIEQQLWTLAESLLPATDAMQAYTQGMMDLGATLCTRSKPRCASCPLRDDCIAHRLGQTADLPTRKPSKALPQRSVRMLLIEHNGQVLLQRRPPTGIWGGLWSLPEIALEADIPHFCRAQLGIDIHVGESLSELQHTFTHFRLTITPQRCSVRSPSPSVTDPSYAWFEPASALEAGIPTAVRKLLLQI